MTVTLEKNYAIVLLLSKMREVQTVLLFEKSTGNEHHISLSRSGMADSPRTESCSMKNCDHVSEERGNHKRLMDSEERRRQRVEK